MSQKQKPSNGGKSYQKHKAMKSKYKYPASINTPGAKKVYRRLKRQIKWANHIADEYYQWFDAERSANNALKEKLKELAK